MVEFQASVKMVLGGVLCVTPSGKTPTTPGRLSKERGSSHSGPPPHASGTFGMSGLWGPSLGGKMWVTLEISFPRGVPGRKKIGPANRRHAASGPLMSQSLCGRDTQICDGTWRISVVQGGQQFSFLGLSFHLCQVRIRSLL